MLNRRGIKHEVLNAKHHERDAKADRSAADMHKATGRARQKGPLLINAVQDRSRKVRRLDGNGPQRLGNAVDVVELVSPEQPHQVQTS